MIDYTRQVNARSRSIRIRIEPNGEVVVSAPKWIPKLAVDAFVAQSSDWISVNRAKILAKKQATVSTNTVTVFGQEYQLVKEDSSQYPIGVRIESKSLIINQIGPLGPNSKTTDTQIQTTLNRFLKNTAEKYIVPRTHQLAKLMNIDFKNITLREQKSRWGSCSSYGNLNFNWRLVHYAPAIIDYVIIHELAHRREMNHSAAFWNIVRKYDPEYLVHRGWLKRHGMAVG